MPAKHWLLQVYITASYAYRFKVLAASYNISFLPLLLFKSILQLD